jgi:hypothetical protein
MELKAIRLEVPDGGNIIAGQTHFIKTVEDLYEAVVNTVPQAKFGIAFNEASGACLTRVEGNDDGLKALAARNATAIGAGHIFVIALGGGAYPINLMNRIKDVPEVCSIFCATANPVEVIVAETEQGRGVLGVVDGVVAGHRAGRPAGLGRKRAPTACSSSSVNAGEPSGRPRSVASSRRRCHSGSSAGVCAATGPGELSVSSRPAASLPVMRAEALDHLQLSASLAKPARTGFVST